MESVVLDLHGEFYPAHSVERSLAAFSAVAELTLEHHPPYHRIRIRARGDVGADRLRHELANYVLAAAATGSHAQP